MERNHAILLCTTGLSFTCTELLHLTSSYHDRWFWLVVGWPLVLNTGTMGNISIDLIFNFIFFLNADVWASQRMEFDTLDTISIQGIKERRRENSLFLCPHKMLNIYDLSGCTVWPPKSNVWTVFLGLAWRANRQYPFSIWTHAYPDSKPV